MQFDCIDMTVRRSQMRSSIRLPARTLTLFISLHSSYILEEKAQPRVLRTEVIFISLFIGSCGIDLTANWREVKLHHV